MAILSNAIALFDFKSKMYFNLIIFAFNTNVTSLSVIGRNRLHIFLEGHFILSNYAMTSFGQCDGDVTMETSCWWHLLQLQLIGKGGRTYKEVHAEVDACC